MLWVIEAIKFFIIDCCRVLFGVGNMTLSLLHVKNIFLPSWNYVCAVDWTEQFYGVG